MIFVDSGVVSFFLYQQKRFLQAWSQFLFWDWFEAEPTLFGIGICRKPNTTQIESIKLIYFFIKFTNKTFHKRNYTHKRSKVH